jgi:adenine phosphoribosyltransferase
MPTTKKISIKKYIRDIPDFPKKGIIFKDITPLLRNKSAFKLVVDKLTAKYKGQKIDYVISVESRGFIFGACLAQRLNCGFIPVRKKGKLPFKTSSITYDLEYGRDTLEMHTDAVKEDDRILIVDDLLATGGTVRAVIDLLEKVGAKIVANAFVIELTALKGRDRLKGYPVFSLLKDKYC